MELLMVVGGILVAVYLWRQFRRAVRVAAIYAVIVEDFNRTSLSHKTPYAWVRLLTGFATASDLKMAHSYMEMTGDQKNWAEQDYDLRINALNCSYFTPGK